MIKRKLDIGQRFGKLTVVSVSKETPYAIYYNFICDCGNMCEYTARKVLHSGNCGCKIKPSKTNNTYRRLRSVWKGMIRRCYNKSHKSYMSYGGRGILVCDRWLKFINFYDDMVNLYQDGLQLDRTDNNGWYSIENCRFVTRKQNMRNTRISKLSESDRDFIINCGMGISYLAKRFNVNYSTIYRVIKYKNI